MKSNDVIGVTIAIALIVVGCVMMIAGARPFVCRKTAEALKAEEHEYSIWAGCAIKQNGKWILLDNTPRNVQNYGN